MKVRARTPRTFIKGDGCMKKILTVICLAALGAACSSSGANVKTAANGNAAGGKNAKYQIIDQEFDNLLAPEADYDTLPAYELQSCGDSYLPPADPKLRNAVKPAVKKASNTAVKKSSNVTERKEVVNVVNIVEVDEPAPAPAGVVSSSTTTTTTTTYNNSGDDLPDTL